MMGPKSKNTTSTIQSLSVQHTNASDSTQALRQCFRNHASGHPLTTVAMIRYPSAPPPWKPIDASYSRTVKRCDMTKMHRAHNGARKPSIATSASGEGTPSSAPSPPFPWARKRGRTPRARPLNHRSAANRHPSLRSFSMCGVLIARALRCHRFNQRVSRRFAFGRRIGPTSLVFSRYAEAALPPTYRGCACFRSRF